MNKMVNYLPFSLKNYVPIREV